MTKQITLDEVKKHNSDKSIWIVIHNDVYDVTKYLDEHPGGVDPLLEVAGGDGSQEFEDVGHSEGAREVLQQFKIGTLPPCDRTKVVNDCCRPKSKWKKSSHHVTPQSEYKPPCSPKVEKRVQTVVVPRERSNLRWAIIALAGALVIGFALKKYLG